MNRSPTPPSKRLLSCLAVWLLATSFDVAASGQDSADMPLSEITIRIPRSMRGYADDPAQPLAAFEGMYVKRMWIAADPAMRLTAADPPPRVIGPPGPFEVMREILRVLESGSVARFVALYDAESQASKQEELSDPDFLEAWRRAASAIEALYPLMAWQLAENRLYVLARAEFVDPESGERQRDLFPVVFDEEFRLAGEKVTSIMANNLLLYFADESRAAEDLIVNRQYLENRE